MGYLTALELGSQVRYIMDGETLEVPITFPRISDDHVKTWTYDSESEEVLELPHSVVDNTVTVSPPVGDGVLLIVHRQTPASPLVDWATTIGETRSARVLAERQARYTALEARDWSQYPIHTITATKPPLFSWRVTDTDTNVHISDSNNGVAVTTPGKTVTIVASDIDSDEFCCTVALPVGATTITVVGGTIDSEGSIVVETQRTNRLLGIIKRASGVFLTSGRVGDYGTHIAQLDGWSELGLELAQAQDYTEVLSAFGLGSASSRDVPSSGDATGTQCVLGTDTRLSNPRPASDVYSWAKAPSKPTYSPTEVGAAAVAHAHNASDPWLQGAITEAVGAANYHVATSSIGYSASNHVTVTQTGTGTSTVTANGLSGRINTASIGLAGGARNIFQVSNDTVLGGSSVIVHRLGTTGDSIEAACVRVFTGGFIVSLTNKGSTTVTATHTVVFTILNPQV